MLYLQINISEFWLITSQLASLKHFTDNTYLWATKRACSTIKKLRFNFNHHRFISSEEENQQENPSIYRYSLWSFPGPTATRWAHLWSPQGGCDTGGTAHQDGDGKCNDLGCSVAGESQFWANMGQHEGNGVIGSFRILNFLRPSKIDYRLIVRTFLKSWWGRPLLFVIFQFFVIFFQDDRHV